MSAEKTDALVIRVTDFSETSRVVSFFTRDFGRISAMAKGARRLKGPFEAALDLLAVCRIVFLRKSSASLDLLTEAQLVRRFRPRGRDLVRLYGGYYVAELLAGLTEEYDPHPVLYDAARSTLEQLSEQEGPNPRTEIRGSASEVDGTAPRRFEPATLGPSLSVLRFELVALREIGQLPNLETCLVCGRSLDGSGSSAHWVSQGGLICRACARDEYRHDMMSSETVALLRGLASPEDSGGATDGAEAPSVSHSQLEQMQRFTLQAISHILGRRPKLHRYLQGR